LHERKKEKKKKKKKKGFITLYKRGLQRRKREATVERKIKRGEGRTEGFCTGYLSIIFKFFIFMSFHLYFIMYFNTISG
jgi:hypothetical protein